MSTLETYKKGILEGCTIDDIERERKFQSEAQRITKLEKTTINKDCKGRLFEEFSNYYISRKYYRCYRIK